MARKRTVAAPKPRNDAYTIMLLITLFAITTGCVLMYLDNSEYEGNAPATAAKLDIPKLGTGPVPVPGAPPAPAAPATPAAPADPAAPPAPAPADPAAPAAPAPAAPAPPP